MIRTTFTKNNGERTSVSLTNYQHYILGLLAKKDGVRVVDVLRAIDELAQTQDVINLSEFVRDYIIESLVIIMGEKGIYL